jgi:hypothetical protein
MKKLLIFLVIVLVLGCVDLIYHPVVLNWKASENTSPSLVYNVYRAPSACPPAGGFQKIGSTPKVTYTDRSIKFGTFCYTVRTSVNGKESGDSNLTQAHVVVTWRH